MAEHSRKAPFDSSDFTDPRHELAREAQELSKAIRQWGLAYARQKLGDEVINQAWADHATNILTGDSDKDEFYGPTQSQRAVEDFCVKELDEILENAYTKTSGDDKDKVMVTINLLAGDLFIVFDNMGRGNTYELEIKPNGSLELSTSSLFTKQSRAAKLKKIIEDMKAAFSAVLAE